MISDPPILNHTLCKKMYCNGCLFVTASKLLNFSCWRILNEKCHTLYNQFHSSFLSCSGYLTDISSSVLLQSQASIHGLHFICFVCPDAASHVAETYVRRLLPLMFRVTEDFKVCAHRSERCATHSLFNQNKKVTTI